MKWIWTKLFLLNWSLETN